jgi:hypothetical protein
MKTEMNLVRAHARNFRSSPSGERGKTAHPPNVPESTPAELRMQDKN